MINSIPFSHPPIRQALHTPRSSKNAYTQSITFSGASDTFKKRLERDEIAFSHDLDTVLDFYASLPVKNLFQSKEDRERIRRIFLQKEHAEYSRQALDETAAGGYYLDELMQGQWDELDIPEEDRRDVYDSTLENLGLPSMPNAPMKEIGQRLGQYYGHEHDESLQNTYGIGESSEQFKNDSQALLHSGIGVIATAINFVKTNPDMARIVERNQILTNPSSENFQNALREWHALFGNDISSNGLHFSGRTKKYGTSRDNYLETFGTLMLSLFYASMTNAIPYGGYRFNKQFHRGFVFNALASTYKLNINEPSIKEDLKKLENFAEATIEAEKFALWAKQAMADSSTGGAATMTGANSIIGILVGAIGELAILGTMDTKLSNYSKKFYDALEDYPRIKTYPDSNNKKQEKLLTKGEVAEQLSKKDSLAYSNYIEFQNQDIDASLLNKLYTEPRYWPKKTTLNLIKSLFSDAKEENKVWAELFTQKNKHNGKEEEKHIITHIIHANKALNPNFGITVPYEISKFPWLKWAAGLPKRLFKNESSA